MIFEIKNDMKELVPLDFDDISNSLGQNEKNLEEALSRNIGDAIFPEYLVFGNERSFQREADIFAIDEYGNLVLFELKVSGHYDRGKIYQALDYAQAFSHWQYAEMNAHYKKCFPERKQELASAFADQFGFDLDTSKYNMAQRIIVISNGSSADIRSVSDYWKRKGIDIQEFFYRIYELDGRKYFELSNELYFPRSYGHCWINTCERHIPGAYMDMVTQAKASAYGDKMYQINENMKSALVFLYHNGYGIIAAGKGTAKIREETEKEEKYISLKDFVHGVDTKNGAIVKYVSPPEIRSLLNQDFWFAKTRVSLSAEQAETLFNHCAKIFA